jgi:regulator of RNase E activity RraA
MPLKTVASEIIEGLAEFDSATVQNAAAIVYGGYISEHIDYSGPDLNPYLYDLDGSGRATVGYAMTSTWTPLHAPVEELGVRHDFMDSIAYANVPTIVVQQDVDLPSRRGAVIGDGMAYQMVALGAVGAVTDGNARDVPGIKKAGLALWATGRVPGHGPFNMIDHGIPVDVAGLHILPGDILVCDGDGVTRVPVDLAEDIFKQSQEVREREAETFAYFSKRGFCLDDWEAYKLHGVG